jgi:hypothetical protein
MQDTILLAVAGNIYQLRTVGGYTSIHHFLTDKYGRKAVGLFSILIVFLGYLMKCGRIRW